MVFLPKTDTPSRENTRSDRSNRLWSRSRRRVYVLFGFLSLVLFGFVAAFFLVFLNQDLRQQAAFFNFLGGESSTPGAVSSLVINGQPVDQVDLLLTQEEPRQFPTVVFANGTQNQDVQVTLSLGEGALWSVTQTQLGAREWQVPTGSYTLTIHQPNTDFSNPSTSLFQTSLLVEEKSIIIITRTENGTPAGLIQQYLLAGETIPQARIFNLSNNTVQFFGGSLDQLTNAEITLPAGTSYDPIFAPRTRALATITSALPGLQRREIDVKNFPLHRLLFFVLGNERAAQLSLVTIPLPLTEADQEAQRLASLPIDYTLTDYDAILKTGTPRDQYFQIENLIRPRQQLIRLWALSDITRVEPWLGKLNLLIDRSGQFVVWAKAEKLAPHLPPAAGAPLPRFELLAVADFETQADGTVVLEDPYTVGSFVLEQDEAGRVRPDAFLTARTQTDLLSRPYWLIRTPRPDAPNQYLYIAQGVAPQPEE